VTHVDESDRREKGEVLAVLRRAGVHERTIAQLDALLGDQVDIRRDANLLARYGITLDSVVDWMGGSL
jgi:hypothetical protein